MDSFLCSNGALRLDNHCFCGVTKVMQTRTAAVRGLVEKHCNQHDKFGCHRAMLEDALEASSSIPLCWTPTKLSRQSSLAAFRVEAIHSIRLLFIKLQVLPSYDHAVTKRDTTLNYFGCNIELCHN